MLFIAIGLITLFASFLIALLMLIRELGQRTNIDETIDDYSLDLAEVVVPTEPNAADSSEVIREASAGSLPQEVATDTSALDQVVPFPWVEVDTQSSQVEPEKPQGTEIVSNERVRGLSLENLNDNFSVRDLVNKD